MCFITNILVSMAIKFTERRSKLSHRNGLNAKNRLRSSLTPYIPRRTVLSRLSIGIYRSSNASLTVLFANGPGFSYR